MAVESIQTHADSICRANTITAEFNGKQRHTNITNANFLTWNWGLSQYVPLDKQLRYLTEFGVMGCVERQLSDSSGPNVNTSKREKMNGIGFQAGIISTGFGLQLNFLYYNEFGGANRLRGSSYSLNLAYTIEKAKQAPAP